MVCIQNRWIVVCIRIQKACLIMEQFLYVIYVYLNEDEYIQISHNIILFVNIIYLLITCLCTRSRVTFNTTRIVQPEVSRNGLKKPVTQSFKFIRFNHQAITPLLIWFTLKLSANLQMEVICENFASLVMEGIFHYELATSRLSKSISRMLIDRQA